MSAKFVLRSARTDDLKSLHDLAGQFSLLNLPADRKVLAGKIERSLASFAGEASKEDAEYLFVCEDLETEAIVGSSLILAKHGTEEVPHYYFKIVKRNRFSDDLGVGFIHQVLQFKEDTDGPTEIGGLLIDRSYRRRPEKLGKQISLVRFLYMAMAPHEFEKRVLCELTPPLGDGGRSEFWEALGRRFTGLPYQEADLISQRNKEFISSLFPEEDIYLALLDSRARVDLGRVGQDTRPAQHLLESIGFEYLNEVDPFDGGPHYGAELANITVVKNTKHVAAVSRMDRIHFSGMALSGVREDGEFRAVWTPYEDRGAEGIVLPDAALRTLDIEQGAKVFYSPVS
ncbi:MAG: arginine N-succinyltransferase [Bdellovibrionales bacterium]|nr:arginine N-succinyltransferase [Bdellovibrionales bacterium]